MPLVGVHGFSVSSLLRFQMNFKEHAEAVNTNEFNSRTSPLFLGGEIFLFFFLPQRIA
jgi:hypothetical protein